MTRSCDEYTWRTTPSRSITYVTRPGNRPSVFSTPYSSRTAPSRSESSRNGNPCLAAKRSEEHTSELQSQSNLVCRLLLEKKKKPKTNALVHSAREVLCTSLSHVVPP